MFLYRLLVIFIIFIILFTSVAIGTGMGSFMSTTIKQLKQLEQFNLQTIDIKSELITLP